MRADVEFLANDLLEGRGTGARGGDIAAAYIASQFAAAGLKPIGDDGTYLQKVPLIGLDTQATSALKFVPAKGEAFELSYLNDFVANALSLKGEEDIDGEVLFAGYGIVAPEFQWNDYKGIDAKGKVVIALVNDPSDDPNTFGGKAMTYYGRWTYKYEEAARQKAAGILLIHNTEMASYGWNVVRNSNSSEQAYLENPPGAYNLPMAGWITEESAKKILQVAGHNLNDLMQKARTRGFAPIELPMRAEAHLRAKVRQFESSNVVGLLEGRDPKKRDEIILYTAHYDHLGVGVPVNGDNIYNGAQDNASGTALVMELARAFAAAKTKPARSIVFLSVTAEERGLRGSEYYGKNPIVPADKTMIDLNYDGLELWGETSDVNVTGAERTSVWPIVQEVAQTLQYTIVPDAHPEAGYYYRSDH
ncbi:MAG TPA: M28 family peptidase, partial [Acidobacteriota bacterium]